MMKRIISILLTMSMMFSMFASFINAVNYDENADDLPFSDVSANDWFYSAVKTAYDSKIMQGTSDDRFSPKKNMSRVEIVTVFYRLAGSTDTGMGETLSFTDTDKDAWYSNYLGWAVSKKLVNGYVDGTFKPTKDITREELAKLFVEFLSLMDIEIVDENTIDRFNDVDSFPNWSKEYIEELRKTGLLVGDQNGNFNPLNTATRAEVATIITRVLPYIDANLNTITNEYSIGDVNFDREAFTFFINSPAECKLQINFFDENNSSLLYSDTIKFIPEDYMTIFEYMPDNFSVPDYFVISATLVDDNNELLSKLYTTFKFTRKYVESISKTPSNFNDEKVIVLNEQNSQNNFMVATDDTLVVRTGNGIGVEYSYDGSPYKLIGDTSSLNITDKTSKIALVTPDNISLVVVEGVDKNDNIILSKIDPELSYNDYFTYIRINDTAYGYSPESVAEQCIETSSAFSSRSVPDINVDLKPKQEISFSKKIGDDDPEVKTKFFGELSVTGYAEGYLNILYDVVIFGDDYLELGFGITFDVKAVGNVGIKTGNESFDDKIYDLKLGILVFPLGYGIFFSTEVSVPLEWELTGKVEVSADASYTFKRIYNTNNGWSTINDPKASLNFDASGKVEMFWGLKVEIELYYLTDDLLAIKASGKAGLKIEVEAGKLGEISTEGVKHACYACLKGKATPMIELEVSAEYNISKILKGKTSIPLSVAMFDTDQFYISLVNDSNSIFKGKMHFGLGECKNKTYKTVLNAIDTDGNKYDTIITLTTDFQEFEEQKEYSISSGDSEYLYNGIYAASCTIDDNHYTKLIIVNGSKSEHNIIAEDDAPVNSIKWNDHYYARFDISMSWTEAKAYCESLGGHLVTITSQEEMSTIVGLLDETPKNNYWIGFRRDNVRANWEWVTKEKVTYTNWTQNEPNDDRKAGECYAHLFGTFYLGGTGLKKYVGQWNDVTNVGAPYSNVFYDLPGFGFVCEWEK